MNLDLTEEQVAIRDTVRELCQNEFAPHAEKWDREDDVPRWAVDKLAELGLLGDLTGAERGARQLDQNANAEPLEFVELRHAAKYVCHQHGFGDLDAQEVRRQIKLFEQRPQHFCQIAKGKLFIRDVHADIKFFCVPFMPAFRRLSSLAQHLFTQKPHCFGFFKNGQK